MVRPRVPQVSGSTFEAAGRASKTNRLQIHSSVALHCASRHSHARVYRNRGNPHRLDLMTGLKFQLGRREHVVVSFRRHAKGGADSCLLHLSLRIGSLRATEESWVAHSDLAQFVTSIQGIFKTLAGTAVLNRESGEQWLSVTVGLRKQIKIRVQLGGYYRADPDNPSWSTQAEFSLYPEGHLFFRNARGLHVDSRHLEERTT